MRGKKCSNRPCTKSSLSYSKYERDHFGGENRMQEKKFDEKFDKELMCVNVDKVYDWIVKENTFDIFPTSPVTFTGLPAGTSLVGATVTCEVVPATVRPIEILNRVDRQFCIDGKNICLQQLTIRKNFTVTIVLTLATGVVFRSTGIAASRNEMVILCAPEGTDVEVTYTELDCFVTSTGTLTLAAAGGAVTFSALVISVTSCQSIQSTFPVTVEILADFCEPREDLPTACPAPSHPPQCPQLFPDHGHGHCRDHGCH